MDIAVKPTASTQTLFETVVNGGYCIGCGACAVVDPQIRIEMDEYGRYQANLISLRDDVHSQSADYTLEICPFSDAALNEDEIGKSLFSDECAYESHIGYYLGNYAGFVKDSLRENSSSGGMATWLLCELFQKKLIDYVIHVRPNEAVRQNEPLFAFSISSSLEQIQRRAKSRYYPVEMSQVLQYVMEKPGRYALVGLPCFVKAVRLLARQNLVIAERIKFCLALFCGQLKSSAFAEYLAWQCGVEPANLQAIDFRKKFVDRPAIDYGVEVISRARPQEPIVKPLAEMYDHTWGSGFFKYHACDYCDDVVGETADVSFGDAWFQPYVADGKGTNIVIVRNKVIHDLLMAGMSEGRLVLAHIEIATIIKSQSGAFNQRRTMLPYRLHLADKAGKWRPPKRVRPRSFLEHGIIRKVQKLRIRMAEESHMAWKTTVASEEFETFLQIMGPIKDAYEKALVRRNNPPWWRKVLFKTARLLKGILRQ